MFDQCPGDVWVYGADDSLAINFQNVPVSILESVLTSLAEVDADKDYILGAAALREGLGPGAWLVLVPRKADALDQQVSGSEGAE